MFVDEIVMGAQPVACAFYLNDDSVVRQSVEQCGGDDRIAEDLGPFGKSTVGCQDHGAFFVTGVDQLKERICAACGDGQIADLVDDEQGRPCIEADFLNQSAFPFGLAQRLDQFGERRAIDAPAGLDGGNAERSADPGRNNICLTASGCVPARSRTARPCARSRVHR